MRCRSRALLRAGRPAVAKTLLETWFATATEAADRGLRASGGMVLAVAAAAAAAAAQSTSFGGFVDTARWGRNVGCLAAAAPACAAEAGRPAGTVRHA